ncbi:hypothetical protein P691DRAFT_754796 [Macrolepiota fuliginosa MF-IS2]|uniref:F-box only protein 9 n=1 Tax=Macrolepiota fuliginosa MF-IS2 TaxID=1400762 RepID=A0A9P6CAP8_9AGAR|nr:hypothetical protein P691DRAFT_754796 [Macrolepiota fuliginosa MF-IS2]
MSPGKAKALTPQEEEPSELARFRAEWRAELENRKRARQTELHPQASTAGVAPGSGPSTSTKPATKSTEVAFVIPILKPKEQDSKTVTTSTGLHPAVTSDGKIVHQKRTKAFDNALGLYKQAVHHEQAGDLDEALSLYRQAFRMDSYVDRAYHREEMLLSIAAQQVGKKPPLPSTASAATMVALPAMTQPHVTEGLDDVTASLQTLSIKPQAPKTGQAAVTGTLGTLVATFLEGELTLTFEPEDELQPVAVNILPEEILVEIIRLLDHTSIERFGRACKKARVLTLESSIWRDLVTSTYKEPQIPDPDTLSEIITRYMFDYRRVYIELPRVRTDGVYIAICHYVRQGASENHWVKVNHLITFHRYLRFYPDGQVLSLLTNEEHPPQTIINMLKPSLRMKGLYIGTWALSGTTIILSNLLDASGRYPLPGVIEAHSHPTHTHSQPHFHTHNHSHSHHSHGHGHGHSADSQHAQRYVFVMCLDLHSKPLGRWNRLDIQSYDTINIETGDTTPVALKHDRPFWFSKESFRSLLQIPGQTSKASGGPGSRGASSKSKKVDASQPIFKPRKVNKASAESKYRDRAAERREGGGNDYAHVEAILEDFERRNVNEDPKAVDEQRKYLGGDGEHSILVKGLDVALFEQNKVRTAVESTEDDETLEQAYLEASSTVPKKRTREDIINELKRKRTQQGQQPEEETKQTAKEGAKALEQAKKQGKFKPIGFKPIGGSEEKEKKGKKKSKTKDGAGKEGVERKKKKRKVEAGLAPGASTAAAVEEAPAVVAEALAPTSTSQPKVLEPEPLGEEFDIFADAGDYDGIDLGDEDDDDDDEDESRPKIKQRDASQEPPLTSLSRKWIPVEEDGTPTISPKPTRDLRERPRSQSPNHHKGPDDRDVEMEGEEEKPMRLQPLEGSALPSIREFLAMDEAAGVADKRRKRKEKKKAGGGGGGEAKSLEGKVDRDFKRLQSYTNKKESSGSR